MKVLLILTTIFVLSACDNPTRTRFQPVDNSSTSIASGTDAVVDDNKDDSLPPGEPVTVPDDGFESCNLGYQYYGGPQIGNFGLCQSTLNESVFKIKLANQDLSVGTCFVPVHIINGGSSFKLGIAECVHNQAGREYDMILTKQRSEPINGVMVIKAGSPLNAYMSCMSAKVDWINAYPGCQNSVQCLQQADNYANQLCTSFVGTYSTFYRQVNL